MGSYQELVAVAGFAQGLCGDGADLVFFETCQAFAEAGQAIPAALHGFRGQVAVCIKPVALADGFLEVFGAVDLAMVKAANFEAKAVGSKIHSSQ